MPEHLQFTRILIIYQPLAAANGLIELLKGNVLIAVRYELRARCILILNIVNAKIP